MGELYKSDLYGIENNIEILNNTINSINNNVSNIDDSIQGMKNELKNLRNDFINLTEEQNKKGKLQEAITELIRVRQEMQKKFGNYQLVRESMLGVLQATDSALVRKDTIASITEELMVSTPEYWLAPCLVAVSAWLSNNRELAKRAIKEAMRRDKERTALAMALICRRNAREKTCHEWLAIYFSKQRSNKLSDSTFTYIDAYLNGIFGKDETGKCEDFIYNWFNKVKSNKNNFEEKQGKFWKDYFKERTLDTSKDFTELSLNVKEYDEINSYVSRLKTAPLISSDFKEIYEANIDKDEMKRKVDQSLVELVNKYDEKEMPLIEEEEKLKIIKECRGDSKKYNSRLKAEQEAKLMKKKKTLDLIEKMNTTITSSDNGNISKKKTSMSFLKNYINNSFENYVKENKSNFPNKITMNIYGFEIETKNGENIDELVKNYDVYIENKRENELSKINIKKPKQYKIGAIILGVLSVLLFLTATILSVFTLTGAIICLVYMKTSNKKINNDIKELHLNFDNKKIEGKQKIHKCINEWKDILKYTNEFEASSILKLI